MVKHFKGGLTLIDDPSKDYIEMKLDPVVGPLATKRDPAGARSALRKLGVERIVAKPGPDGWDFEGLCNLSRLVSNKGVSAPPGPPRSETPRRSRGVPRHRFAIAEAPKWPSEQRVRQTPHPILRPGEQRFATLRLPRPLR